MDDIILRNVEKLKILDLEQKQIKTEMKRVVDETSILLYQKSKNEEYITNIVFFDNVYLFWSNNTKK